MTAGALRAFPAQLAAQTAPNNPGPVLDIAEWSYHWYGVEHALLARGTVSTACRCMWNTGFPRRFGIRIRSF